MKRFCASVIVVAIALLIAPSAFGQTSVCPKDEVLQFGNLFGYSTMVCKKEGEKCGNANSDVFFFYVNRVNNLGCGFLKDCGKCRTPQTANGNLAGRPSYYRYAHNFNINRQNNVNSGVFLDSTKGISKTNGLEFAATEVNKSKTYYAIFNVSVKYQLPKSEKVEYLSCPVALQLAVKPPVTDILDAKLERTKLKVTGTDDKETEFALILQDSSGQVYLKSDLLKRGATETIPDPAPKKKEDAKKEPAPAAKK
jgi:hypothetical protein